MAANLHSNDGDLGFQVAPMVDVVFVLMLFFLASAAFQDREFDLDAALPVPAHPGTSPIAIDVSIASDGSVYLLNKLVAAAGDRRVTSLSEWLRAARRTFGEGDPLVISPAPTVKHERVMEVLNAVAEAQWTKVSLR